MADLKDLTILIRGAGEMASGVAYRLWRSGFRLLMTELPSPLAVRRAVSFCEAVHEGSITVEEATAVLVRDLDQAHEAWARDELPVIVDPELAGLESLKPDVFLEASLSKRNTYGLNAAMAPLVIALGPGFSAPEDADFIIETNRGHNLGRLIELGPAEADTGKPGNIEGYTVERVLRAPVKGLFETDYEIGRLVEQNETVALVDGQPVKAGVAGMIRGLIRPGTPVPAGLKLGDVDPRGKRALPKNISEKARAIGGAVLEAILNRYNR